MLSPSSEARAYALEYAASHAPDISVERLVELIEQGGGEVAKFAAARLESLTPAQLGLRVLLRLVRHTAAPWAETKLAQGFAAKDIDVATFVDTSLRSANHFGALIKFFNDKQAAIPANYWTALVDDRRSNDWPMRSVKATALTELGKKSAREIGVAWIQKALENRETTDAVVRWLDAGMLAGSDLDVEWLKSLVGKPRLRPVALRVLGDRRRVAPARVGLSWLLDLARSTDTELAGFAQRMLLESFEPKDFAPGDSIDNQAGVQRLWELATGKKSPEAVRQFAATYLKAHHPDLGPRLPEAKALLFDAYELDDDSVVEKISQLKAMASVEQPNGKKNQRPSFCVATWGTQAPFRCVIESMSVKYTMFSQDGTPLRAVVTLGLKSGVRDLAIDKASGFGAKNNEFEAASMAKLEKQRQAMQQQRVGEIDVRRRAHDEELACLRSAIS